MRKVATFDNLGRRGMTSENIANLCALCSSSRVFCGGGLIISFSNGYGFTIFALLSREVLGFMLPSEFFGSIGGCFQMGPFHGLVVDMDAKWLLG